MKKIINLCLFVASIYSTNAQSTAFEKTDEKFDNNEFVWQVKFNDIKIGEFWPVHGIEFLPKGHTDYNVKSELPVLQKKLRAIAIVPGSMTGNIASTNYYFIEGKSISKGNPCSSDGIVHDCGIIVVDEIEKISFRHAQEFQNFDSLYSKVKESKNTLFFLPSMYRNGNYLSSNAMIDKVLIRRTVPDGEQIGVIIFDKLTTYDQVREIVLGLDRDNRSKTTHIYVLDGGPIWGQCLKHVNDKNVVIGTRDVNVITNYLILY